RISAPFGIELRHPFFDKRLVEFCLALPAEQKMRGGWTRIVLRQAMDKLLPREIQWRVSKSNLGPGFVRNLATHDGALIDNVLTKPPHDFEQYADVSKLRRVFERYKCHPTTGDAMVLWRAANVALWISVSPAQSPTEIA
ncbi:MAG: asparagine synthase-related protein, partial [Euryarchaeota archaeon]